VLTGAWGVTTAVAGDVAAALVPPAFVADTWTSIESPTSPL
jgi:hypothetical protein